MTDSLVLLQKVCVFACAALFVSGVLVTAVRRVAAWALVGQLFSLKAVAVGSFLLAQRTNPSGGDLMLLSLCVMGLVPMVAAIGMLVLHRSGRFGGSLDSEEETGLKL